MSQMFMPTFCPLAWWLTPQCDLLYDNKFLDFGTDYISVEEADLSVSLTEGYFVIFDQSSNVFINTEIFKNADVGS